MVVLFAFLASSFAARNSDFWFHLSAGRLLYLLYTVVGGPVLVALKALLIAVLAWLLLRLRRPDGGVAWPAAGTLLALLVLVPHLLLQPAILSYLFLGLTLWLLWRPHHIEERKEPHSFSRDWKRFGLLPFLMALWGIEDSGVFFGLLLVGLFWLGERLEYLARRDVRPRTPTWLPLVCVAASLFNPHPWHVLALPAELSPGMVAADGFQRLFSSPWRWSGSDGPFLAEAAYFALSGLGLLSFFLNRRHLSGWRLAVWIGFALLGAWRTCLTPFFAVVAGPLAALNMQDFLFYCGDPAYAGTNRRRLDWLLLGRFLVLASGLGLIFLAGSGRLRGMHGEPRPICWAIQPDPSLQRLAETVSTWRQQGQLRDGERILAFDPSVADYFAWICPEVELHCPHRFQPHEAASQFAEARRALACKTEDADRCSRLLREWSITYVAVDETDALDELSKHSEQWTLRDVSGRTAIFARKDAGQAPLDVGRLAFAPDEEDRIAPPAPAQGPGRGPKVPSFWSFCRPAPPSTWESEAATTYLRLFHEAAQPQYARRWAESWSVYAAVLAGSTPVAAPAPVAVVPLLARLHHPPSFLGDIDRELPALPLLAVRAARRALAANPEDANAYLRLGQAYLALWEKTGERPLSRADAPLLDLRHVQTVTALEQAVLRDPDVEAAHRLLGRLYTQHSYFDAALDHRREELRLAHRIGPRRGEGAEAFSQRLRRLERQVQDLQRVVAEKQKEFDASDRGGASDPASRAKRALGLGLARRALEDILSPASPVLLESSGLQLELQLMLRLGRAEQLRDFMLDPKREQDQANLGSLELPAPPVPGYPLSYRLPAYSWLRLCWTAAVGDYSQFEDQLRDLLEQLSSRQREQSRLFRRASALALTTEIALSAQPQTLLLRPAARDGRLLVMQSFLRTSSFRGDQADFLVLGGLVALERGLPHLAERHLKQAHKISPIDGNASQEFAMRALADAYLQRIRAAARESKKSADGP